MYNVRSTCLLLSGAFSLTMLTGCPNAGTQPPMSGNTPSAPASAPASTAPAASATPAANEASVAPSVTPSTSPLEATTLRGKVFDDESSAVSAAKVSVKSLNSSSPFESTVDVVGGSYVVNGVPAGVQLQITASKEKWTSRSRVETLLPLSSAQSNIVNFGGSATDADGSEGAAYFISKYPEIVSAVADYTGAKLTYTLKVSEPLGEDDRRRLENGLILQGNPDASGLIILKKGSAFSGDRVLPKFTWDTTGTTLTFEFEAPLRGSKLEATSYSLVLTRPSSTEDVKDSEGNILGMGLLSGDQYREAFKLATPVASAVATSAARWEATHTGTATFDVPKDDTSPKLASVAGLSLNVGGGDKYRFMLTFSEPMVAYPEATSFAAGTKVLANYYFALSKNEMAGIDVDKPAGTPVSDPASAQAALDSNSVFNFSAGAVEFNQADPRIVYITVDRNLVPTTAKHFKVRVDGAADPAGNTISTTGKVSADLTADNIKLGRID